MSKSIRRCVIIGGADIGDYAAAKKYLRSDDFNVFCDSGLRHLKSLGIGANLIIGDFDSHQRPDTEVEIIELPRVKDDTDTVYAVKEALKRGFDDFLLIGVVGERLDHTLGNLSLLLWLNALEKHAVIVDDYSEMEIVSDTPAFVDSSFAFFSLLNISGTAKGVNIENAKYPLKDAEITCEYQYGVSNEVLPGSIAKVYVREGKLLLIKVRHD